MLPRCNACAGVFICCPFADCTFLQLSALTDRVGVLVCKRLVCPFHHVSSVIGAYVDRYYATRLIGHKVTIWDVDGLLQDFNDTRVLLAIDAIVTGTHLLLPVRWCTLVGQQIASVLLYAVPALVVGSPEKELAFSTWYS